MFIILSLTIMLNLCEAWSTFTFFIWDVASWIQNGSGWRGCQALQGILGLYDLLFNALFLFEIFTQLPFFSQIKIFLTSYLVENVAFIKPDKVLFAGVHRRSYVQQRPHDRQQEPDGLLWHCCRQPATRQGNLWGETTKTCTWLRFFWAF